MARGPFFTWRTLGGGIAVFIILALTLSLVLYSSHSGVVLEAPTIGPIHEEVSASGRVESPERIDLFFKGVARLRSLNVGTGETVRKGDILAEQESSDLEAARLEAAAAVDIARAKLERLEVGAGAEEIQIAETAVLNATQSVQDSHKVLRDAIQDSYTKADDALLNKGDQMLTSPKSSSPQLSFAIADSSLKGSIESQRISLGISLDRWAIEIGTLSLDSRVLVDTESAKNYLGALKAYLTDLAQAASLATPSGSLTQTTIDK